jgi:hypothetical protein
VVFLLPFTFFNCLGNFKIIIVWKKEKIVIMAKGV